MGRDPEYLAFLRRFLADSEALSRAAERDGLRGLAAARAVHAAELAALPRAPLHRVEDVVAGGVAGRLYVPDKGAPPGLLVFAHGGGWVLGDVESYDPVVRALAAASGAAVLSVEYRRPPRHRFPAAVDDVAAAVAAADGLAARLGTGKVAVGGDSAGGQIAAAAAHRLGAAGRRPAGLVLVYPAVDLRSVPSPPPDPDGLEFPGQDLDGVLAAYLGDADRTDPEVSPLLAPDFSVLPPTVVATAGHDRLRAQGEAFAARLRDAGVEAVLLPGDGLDHGFLGWGPFARRAADAVAGLGAAVRALFTE
ncbi:Carboxylesterase NlhH [Actinomadura rubteroloni]|uniref:Carboxylesterase NlhH n=1 Tax=Actinomadura rubteroloni TaxID=1926885 RepID=A0A2P4UC63_9ACTN|nr:alpha/beta hydrolase fold domain-containing protein [Actinomadura rubteroloni]POM22627.1 Carboxylesterase NlhH [Actinomadura rubteroloni]